MYVHWSLYIYTHIDLSINLFIYLLPLVDTLVFQAKPRLEHTCAHSALSRRLISLLEEVGTVPNAPLLCRPAV